MEQRDGIVRLIGILKLLKGLLLVAVGFGALSLVHRDVGHAIHRAIRYFHIADDNRFVREAIARLGPHELEEIELGSFVYAVLFVVEGTGLLLRRLWAEYLTIVITASFIPLEIYELVEHPSVIKALVIVVNIAIVAYLVYCLHRNKHWPFRSSLRP